MNINFNSFVPNFNINKIAKLKEKFSNFLLRTPLKDVFESNTLDIYSKGKFPSNVLSNFHESKFEFDGVKINSMEGFLQSLKTPDMELQKNICKMVGKDAKNAGTNLAESYDKKTLYWNGQKIDRFFRGLSSLIKKGI